MRAVAPPRRPGVRLAAGAAALLEAGRPLGRRELALAGALLAALGALAYGPHAAEGGFVSDDWENAATTADPPDGRGFLGPIDLRTFAYRPLLALVIPLPHLLFGDAAWAHLALAAALAVVAAVAVYALLRTLGLEPLHAGAIAIPTAIRSSRHRRSAAARGARSR